MGIVTTHSEGRVVTHSADDRDSVEVVQLPARDAAVQTAAAATSEVPPKAPAAAKVPVPAAKPATVRKPRTKKR
jgi:hypothetical protein